MEIYVAGPGRSWAWNRLFYGPNSEAFTFEEPSILSEGGTRGTVEKPFF